MATSETLEIVKLFWTVNNSANLSTFDIVYTFWNKTFSNKSICCTNDGEKSIELCSTQFIERWASFVSEYWTQFLGKINLNLFTRVQRYIISVSTFV